MEAATEATVDTTETVDVVDERRRASTEVISPAAPVAEEEVAEAVAV
jgi:hypothetical protein